jgi:hypothetical protein
MIIWAFVFAFFAVLPSCKPVKKGFLLSEAGVLKKLSLAGIAKV